jgi:Spy/CpxP family protein refolding chaperone
MLALLAVSFAALGVTDALARHHGRGAMGGEGPDEGFGMIRMLDRLDLTQDQQGQVASLLKTHRGDIEQAMNDMAQARSSLWDAMNATEVSEENVKKVARVVADQHEQMILLRAKVINGMRRILTPEQNTRFQSLASKRGCRMQGFVETRMSALDQWIAKHGK